jgi:hypothetical protein
VWHLLIPPRSCHDDILEGATQSGRPSCRAARQGEPTSPCGRALGVRRGTRLPGSLLPGQGAGGAARYTRSRPGGARGLVAPSTIDASRSNQPRPPTSAEAGCALDRIPVTPRSDHPEAYDCGRHETHTHGSRHHLNGQGDERRKRTCLLWLDIPPGGVDAISKAT